ncbi:uncharacterized protein LOC105013370 [Esox lucius]|nr:uncharacterized protein LOC105013370 [Esox lucius]
MLKTPVRSGVKSSSGSEQATTSAHQGAVMQPVADGKTCPSLQGGIPIDSPQHYLSSGANNTSSKRQDKQMEARAQIAAPSKNEEAKAWKKTPDSSESYVLSRGVSPESAGVTLENPRGSNAQNTNAKMRNSLSTKHVVTSKLNANAGLVEQPTVADSSVGLAPRGGVSWDGINWVPIEPEVMTNTVAMSEPQLNATMSQRGADRSTSPENTSKFPLLLTNKSSVYWEAIPPLIQAVTVTNLLPTQNGQLCVKTSAKVVKEHEAVTNALPFQDSLPNVKPSAKATMAPVIKALSIQNNHPSVEPSVKEIKSPAIKPLTIQDNLPSVKPSAKATNAQNIMRVVCIPEVTGVGSIITTTPMFSLSEACPSKSGKVQCFLKTKCGEQEGNDILPIAKGSYRGLEQRRSKDYSRRASLSYNIPHHLNQFRTDSERLNSKEVTKRRTMHSRNSQHWPNQQMPELERFKPRNITRRKDAISCDHLQKMPSQPIPDPDKVPPLKLKAVPPLKGSILYKENKKQNLHHWMPVHTMKTEDLGEFLDSLGISNVEDQENMVSDEPLTDSECDVFKEVFAKFAKNSNGCIDAKSLACTLDRVGVSISPEEVQKAMQAADYDEDGEVGFQDFLRVLTDSQLFSKCVKAEGVDSSQFVELWERVFYKALNQMLESGTLSCSITGELVRYYHRKTLGLIRRSVRLGEQEDGRILNYYTKGVHLIGLKRKQLLKYIQPLPQIAHEMIAQNQKRTSPYSKRPSLYVDYYSSNSQRAFLRVKKCHVKTAKTWKPTEIMDCFRQLPVSHTGMEAEEMITPVKIKVNMTIKERNQLTYNEINKITQMSKSGLKGYLEALTQLKRRDAWNLWVSLQYLVHNQKDFFQTFTTYSWSWSGCCNTTGIRDLDALYRSSPSLSRSQLPEPTDIKQLTSSNQCG